jgi:hypothetical protein
MDVGNYILGENEELTLTDISSNESKESSSKKIKKDDHANRELDQEWRLKLHNLIKTNQLQLTGCKIFDYFESYYVVPKQSSSETSTTFLKYLHEIDGNRLFVSKIWWKELSENNSLDYESAVYEIIINFLIKNNFTPHVASYLALAECSLPEFIKAFGKSINSLKMYKQILNITQKRYNQYTLKILMTENVKDSEQLLTLIDRKLFKNEYNIDLMSICFQIVYTYECFNRVGLRHNDGHLGNILVTDYSKVKDFPEFIIYELNHQVYAKVPAKYFVRIIDFDLASFVCDKTKIHPFYYALIDQFKTKIGSCDNSVLTHRLCNKYDLCNNVEHKKFDTYQTFWGIKTAMLPFNSKHPIISWMNNIFDDFKGDIKDDKTKRMSIDRWLKKEYDSNRLMFPIDILLTQFPQFIKQKSSPQFNHDKAKYPSFMLPLTPDEKPFYSARPTPSTSSRDRFVAERQGLVIDANISVSEDETDDDDEYGRIAMDISPPKSFHISHDSDSETD